MSIRSNYRLYRDMYASNLHCLLSTIQLARNYVHPLRVSCLANSRSCTYSRQLYLHIYLDSHHDRFLTGIHWCLYVGGREEKKTWDVGVIKDQCALEKSFKNPFFFVKLMPRGLHYWKKNQKKSKKGKFPLSRGTPQKRLPLLMLCAEASIFEEDLRTNQIYS